MRVIWIDPGETVGWATATVTKANGLHVLDYGNTKLKRFALALLAGAAKYDVVGYESYVIRPDKLRAHAGSDVPTLQLIGMIRQSVWSAQRGRAVPIKLLVQPPLAQSKGRGAARLVFNDDIRAAIAEADQGPHDDGHYASALLHLAAWYHATYGGDA